LVDSASVALWPASSVTKVTMAKVELAQILQK